MKCAISFLDFDN